MEVNTIKPRAKMSSIPIRAESIIPQEFKAIGRFRSDTAAYTAFTDSL